MQQKQRRPIVLFVITCLNVGGAETMALKLIRGLRDVIDFRVIVLMGRGALSEKLDALCVPVCYLGLKQGGLPGVSAIFQMVRFAQEFRPDAVQGWMYHGNLAAWLLRKFLKPRPVLLWNIRQTLYDLKFETKLTSFIIKLGGLLSRAPNRIIYNSMLSAQQHEALGYNDLTRAVIPNGFDIETFRPDAQLRKDVLRELGLHQDLFIVGHVARFHKMKDHDNMLHAAREVIRQCTAVRFLFFGRGMTLDNHEIVERIEKLGLKDHVMLLGERGDISRFYTVFDLAVSSSAWGEGFPNVIGEAMASGVPCVVTDVGDSASVVGQLGRVVAPADSSALARSIIEIMTLDAPSYAELGAACRKRIKELYSSDRVRMIYYDVYMSALKEKF